MARMLTKDKRDRAERLCCKNCCTGSGRRTHGGRLDPRFRKLARAADEAAWKRSEV
jgi:hypothetical protein